MKFCSRCQRFKDFVLFYKRKASPDGLQSFCKKCQDHHHKGRMHVHARNASTWRKNNIERERKRERLKYVNNPTYKRRMTMRRYALKLGAFGTHTIKQFLDLCAAYEWKCRYCSKLLNINTATEDHAIPLIRGGSDDISNIRPCCHSCNSRKGALTERDYLKKLSEGGN